VAALLPALMLARIDGKSPVEYITESAIKEQVRAFAGALLVLPVAILESVAERWAKWDRSAEAGCRAEEDRA
jgi:hypothetical protein